MPNREKLTDALVGRLTLAKVQAQTGSQRTQIIVWDTGAGSVQRFGVVIGAAKKTFIINHRDGRRKIGQFPMMNVEQARREALKWLAQREQGIDLRVEKQATKEQNNTMLYDAIDAYVEYIKATPVGDTEKENTFHRLNALKAIEENRPMRTIDYQHLAKVTNYMKSRPLARRGEKRRLKAKTIRGYLAMWRAFFVWCDKSSYGGWEGPKYLADLFHTKTSQLMTDEEKARSNDIPQFTITELVKLYHAASPTVRSWMLTALFTGCLQKELSVLIKSEFNLDAGMLRHNRHKTGVPGQYWLPPELVALLRDEFAARPMDTLVFRTRKGETLCGKGRRDAVRLAWDKVRIKAKLPTTLSFSSLRDYIGNKAKEHGGDELMQCALSHRPTTIGGRHYTSARPFDRFNALQKRMYAELKQAGFFDVPAEVEQDEIAMVA